MNHNTVYTKNQERLAYTARFLRERKHMAMEDNFALWQQHERDMEASLARRPQCECCGQYIQDDYTWEIDGELLCPECAADKFRRATEDLMGGQDNG